MENKHTGSTLESFLDDRCLPPTTSSDLTMETVLKAKEDMNNTILEAPVEAQDDDKTVVLDKDEEAAYFLHLAHKEFRLRVLAGRKKQTVSRILEAVLFEPFEKVQLFGKEEEDLFALCNKVMYAKDVVFKYAQKRAEELKKGETSEQTEK